MTATTTRTAASAAAAPSWSRRRRAAVVRGLGRLGGLALGAALLAQLALGEGGAGHGDSFGSDDDGRGARAGVASGRRRCCGRARRAPAVRGRASGAAGRRSCPSTSARAVARRPWRRRGGAVRRAAVPVPASAPRAGRGRARRPRARPAPAGRASRRRARQAPSEATATITSEVAWWRASGQGGPAAGEVNNRQRLTRQHQRLTTTRNK